jgi:hypothetical protein
VSNGASGNVRVNTPGGTSALAGFIYTDLNELVINPNPAKDIIIVKHPAAAKAAYLKLIDNTGKKVRLIVVAQNSTQTSFSVKGLATGIYRLIWQGDFKQLKKTLMITQ